MSAFAELSRSVAVKASTVARLELAGGWGKWREAAPSSARIYACLGGAAIVETASGSTALRAGELAFLPRSDTHVIREPSTRVAAGTSACKGMREEADQRHANSTRPDTQLVLVDVELDAEHAPWLALLPQVVTVTEEHLGQWLSDTLALLSTAHALPAPLRQEITATWVHALYTHSLERMGALGHGLEDGRLVEAIGIIRARPQAAWTLQELAGRVGLSRSVLAEGLSGLLGEPLGSWRRRLRMDHAAALLDSTDLPVKLVASRSGYDSEPAFARAFTRVRGTSPASYRRRDRAS